MRNNDTPSTLNYKRHLLSVSDKTQIKDKCVPNAFISFGLWSIYTRLIVKVLVGKTNIHCKDHGFYSFCLIDRIVQKLRGKEKNEKQYCATLVSALIFSYFQSNFLNLNILYKNYMS
jgi:hypothetical protein